VKRIDGGVADLGDLVEDDSVSEGLELLDVVVALLVRIDPAGEVVAAEVFKIAVVREEVPADHEDRVCDGGGGFLLADATGESPELC